VKLDWTSDDVQIPSSFFKVIVWKGRNGIKSVGLVVDQNELMLETRVNLDKPKPLAPVNIHQWRVSVADIEKRTELDFGATIRNADTIDAARQPNVGEALLRIASFDDLL
jgi:endonuclease G